MTSSLSQELTWPVSRAGDALSQLLEGAPATLDVGNPSVPGPISLPDVARFLEAATTFAGAEIEHVSSPFDRCRETVEKAAPALLWIASPDREPCLVVLLPGRRRRGKLLVACPDGGRRDVDAASVAGAWAAATVEKVAPSVDVLLERAAVAPERRGRAREALIGERLGPALLEGCFLLRIPPGGSTARQLAAAGVAPRLAAAIGASIGLSLLSILAWWILGMGALQGRADPGWLPAWALLIVTSYALLSGTSLLVARLVVHLGALLKRRLLEGSLRLEPEETRHEGVGQQLGRVAEVEAFQALAYRGSTAAIFSSLELLIAGLILSRGAAGMLHVGVLLGWTALSAALALVYHHRREAWSEARLAITHDLVERLVGHRTRLVQQPRAHWHDAEDRILARYHELSVEMDRAGATWTVLAARGYLLLAVVALLPSFAAGGAGAGSLAVTIGGTVLAYQALGRVTGGFLDFSEAAIAWGRVRSLHDAAARPEPTASPAFVAALDAASATQGAERHVVLEMQDVAFRHANRPDPVLRNLDLRVLRGDRLLLQGASGSGKSTLLSLLGGRRSPSSGVVHLRGLDRHTVGARAWRRHVATAPQFHENHVLSASFGFNLLMGRGWPPSAKDYADAKEVCDELGLGELLARMPSGFEQMVGETGWQLSHGEKSRLYVARALLQDAALVVLDESFAALDPETLEKTLACVRRRAETLIVVAHP